ncbi:Mitochondrial distribution and morphology protein 10 [Ceratocystis fimbriata CBS 114723]|uniref:Mitochondrial distribution and morphology protein 10 n=1 Tax=Ceratocystis fimbriata CBS 114723 TaxID=1035309 RepID=A0A2C5X240_9PEZI|nr:Mitochondrial distribution and morphology protein 10 [Ceratocystis fimbriata CBS 114723]
MREFMEAVQKAFYDATGWHRDNSYSSLDVTADGLLNFHTPQGLHMTLSSLATPQFATSYELGTIGVVDGSLSYLYSSVPVQRYFTPQSEKVSLPSRMQSYRSLSPLNTDPSASKAALNGSNATSKFSYPSLLYGRLYLPQSMLEALVVKKLSSALQVQLSAVSSKTLRNGGTVLGLAQYDVGRYAIEGLASSDGGLLGLRGIYNFHAHDEKAPLPFPGDGERERIFGRFSTGAEIYYGTLNKSGGISLGARFATLPEHMGTPLTATLTINPLMGSISASYAVMAGKLCTLGTRLDFNVYSYESDWMVGIELWRKSFPSRVAAMSDAVEPDKSKTANIKRPSTQRQTENMAMTSQKPKPLVGQALGSTMKPVPAQSPQDNSSAELPAAQTSGFERSFQAKMEWRLDAPPAISPPVSAATAAATSSVTGTKPSSPLGSSPAPASPLYTPSTPPPVSTSVHVTPLTTGPTSLTKSQGSLAATGVTKSSVPAVIAGDDASAGVTVTDVTPPGNDSEEYREVIKARLDQNMRIGLLWEGRVKALLFGLGFAIDFRRRDQPFRTVGLEVQYSS